MARASPLPSYTFLAFQLHGPLYCSIQTLDLYLESIDP